MGIGKGKEGGKGMEWGKKKKMREGRGNGVKGR